MALDDLDEAGGVGIALPIGVDLGRIMNDDPSQINVRERYEAAAATPSTPAAATPSGAATDGQRRSLWFDLPSDGQDRRRQLTRERVVEEALAVIAQDGAEALTMRGLAARLGVVPGALYHHVRNKQLLQDLVLDSVLAEVDLDLEPSLGWIEQLKVLAQRLRQVLEGHPGVAGILRTRDPLGPHSLILAEASSRSSQATYFVRTRAGFPA